MSRLALLAGALGVLWLGPFACTAEPDLSGAQFACDTDDDCLAGQTCQPLSQICVDAVVVGDTRDGDVRDTTSPADTTPADSRRPDSSPRDTADTADTAHADTVQTDTADTGPVDTRVQDTTATPPRDTTTEDTVAPVDTAPPDGLFNCVTYCAKVTKRCVGVDAQYVDEAACVARCARQLWSRGQATDTTGNTLGCRVNRAHAAAGVDRAARCIEAGPTGGGACGSWCDNYCFEVERWCGASAVSYASPSACSAACAGFGGGGAPGDPTGDTVQCRLTHLWSAGEDLPGAKEAYCPSAGVEGGVCSVVAAGSPAATCENYCAIVQSACLEGVTSARYEDPAECLQQCRTLSAFATGAPGDVTGNSIACRISNVLLAFVEHPSLHCAAGTPVGGGTCGTPCENYCDVALAHCTGANVIFASPAQCASQCAGLSVDGSWGETTSDTLQCRLHHANEAGRDPASASSNCARAAIASTACTIPPVNCTNYCGLIASACGTTEAPVGPYPSVEACETFCESAGGLPLGAIGATSGNSVACRMSLAQAATGPEDVGACTAAGPSGANVCGTWCDNYCHLAGRFCTGEHTLFASDAACLSACASLSDDAPPDATAGDSVQCRLAQLRSAGDNHGATAARDCAWAAVSPAQSSPCRSD